MRRSGYDIGRVRAVFVFGTGPVAKAAMTTITVRLRRRPRRTRLRASGPVRLDPSLLEHYRDTLLPIVDRVATALGLRQRRPAFELSVTNCGAASAFDRGVRVVGFSADAAVLLALLSALLRLPVLQSVVCSAHVASPIGELGPVQNLEAKLAAACKISAVRTFLFAPSDTDSSLQELVPDLVESDRRAVGQSKTRFRLVAIADVAELLRHVSDDEAVMWAGLTASFFGVAVASDGEASPVERALEYLTEDWEARFWRVLDGHLQSGKVTEARHLLSAHVQHDVRMRRYPARFGERLLLALRALPPNLLHVKALFPLLPARVCLDLGRLAAPVDYEDLTLFQRAVAGRPVDIGGTLPSAPVPTTPGNAHAEVVLTAILNEISADTLAWVIDRPIDDARLAYVVPSLSVEHPGELEEAITAFHLFVLRRLGLEPGAVNDHYKGEALELLERAFAGMGGVPAARAEACEPTYGGLRLVLDEFTRQLKLEFRRDRVRYVVETAINGRTWEERLAITAALRNRLRPQLSPDLRDLPSARLNDHLVEIMQVYVQSLDNMKRALRRF